MSSIAYFQFTLILVGIWLIMHHALQASMLAGLLAAGFIMLTMAVWVLAEAVGGRP